MARLLFAVVSVSLGFLLTCALAPQGESAEPSDLAKKVQELIVQLDDAQKAEKAETELLKLGTAILPFLGDKAAKNPAQLERLKAIRGRLQEAQAAKELAVKKVTLKEKEIPLSKALKAVREQTGIAVEDGRQATDKDPSIRLDLKDATFWQAIDTIAKEADLKVAFPPGDLKVALVEGPFIEMPTSYSGMFRVVLKRLLAIHDLETSTHACAALLEVAWEPRFKPFIMMSEPEALVIQNDKGVALGLIERENMRESVGNTLVAEFEIRFQAPARSVAKLGAIKGHLDMIGPNKMLTFTFEDLAKIERKDPKQTRTMTQENVTVKLRELDIDDDVLAAKLIVEYPDDSPDFEQMNSWIVTNKIHLKHKSKKALHEPLGGSEVTEQGAHKAVVIYRFVETDTLDLKKITLKDWQLHYETPAGFLTVPIPFEFKDVALP